MKQLTPEQIGLDYRALLDLIGEERIVDLVGAERLIEFVGAERLVAALLRRKGAQWLRTAIERGPQQPDTPGEPQAPAGSEN